MKRALMGLALLLLIGFAALIARIWPTGSTPRPAPPASTASTAAGLGDADAATDAAVQDPEVGVTGTASEIQRTTQNASDAPTPGAPADGNAEVRAFLKDKLAELDSFKGNPDFRLYGFGAGGPYNAWLSSVQEMRRRDDGLAFDENLALAELLSLGMEYVSTRGAENDATRRFREQVTAVLQDLDEPIDPLRFGVGDVVEVAGSEPGITLIGATGSIYANYLARGRGSLQTGKDLFAVPPSELAEVLGMSGDLVHIRLIEGSWKGRNGWIRSADLRPRPTEEAPEAEADGELSLSRRRTIYAEIYREGMLATYEAEARYPLANLANNPASAGRDIRLHQEVYEASKAKRLAELAKRLSVTPEDLEAIEEEGMDQRWPLPEVANPFKDRVGVTKSGSKASERSSARSPATDATTSAATLLRMGDSLSRSGRASAAEGYFRRILEEHPDAPEADEARARLGGAD